MNLFKFPTGEAHCKLNGSDALLHIPMQPNVNDYFMTVLLACDANLRARDGRPFDLYLPYLPYSRQDRPTSHAEPFSLKVIGAMLNQTACRRIYTLDAHSDVAFACIDNLVNIPQSRFVLPALGEQTKEMTLVIPDQGAVKKATAYAASFADVVTALKHRDTATGRLEIEGVFGDVDKRDCLIADDICDGGMTFKLLADYLFKHGASSVSLAITHGVFTKGIDVLFDAGIKAIYTTDSFPQTPRTNLTVSGASHILNDFITENYS